MGEALGGVHEGVGFVRDKENLAQRIGHALPQLVFTGDRAGPPGEFAVVVEELVLLFPLPHGREQGPVQFRGLLELLIQPTLNSHRAHAVDFLHGGPEAGLHEETGGRFRSDTAGPGRQRSVQME